MLYGFHMLPVWPSAITEQVPLIEKVNWRAKLVNLHLGELGKLCDRMFPVVGGCAFQSGQVVQVKC
jgi:hypothetical protein